MRVRLAIWTGVAILVVLATRTIAYALAPQSVLLAALAHGQVGPDVTVPLVVAVIASVAAAAAVVWLAAMAVRERLLIEGRTLVAPPRLKPALLLGRTVVLFAVTSFAFAMVESTIHWREGLGWHGLRCLTGPVHRDAIPILAALSILAVALHGAVEHLVAWARRVFAQLAARGFEAGRCAPGLPEPRQPSLTLVRGRAPARGPPACSPSLSIASPS